MRAATLAAAVVGVAALPGDERRAALIAAFKEGHVEAPCTDGVCAKPTKKYERILNTQPGYQWDDAGGYCGSWSIQRAAMAKGAWISQQQVRDHTVRGGGHDEEILETNIEPALTNLKLKFEGFDYKNLPTPQLDSGRSWMKRQLAAGHPLVMMIMEPLDEYPVYKGLPYGDYSHIEPVVGILSDKPLTDEDFYDDDFIVHYNDNNLFTYYRSMSSLPGKYGHQSRCPGATALGSSMCLHPDYVFGWAIQGFADPKEGLPMSLTVDKSMSEPDIRQGEAPKNLIGTLTIEGLQTGSKYAIYRWDSVETAFDYSKPLSVHRFTASNETESYTDSQPFSSDGTIYYRCIVDDAAALTV